MRTELTAVLVHISAVSSADGVFTDEVPLVVMVISISALLMKASLLSYKVPTTKEAGNIKK